MLFSRILPLLLLTVAPSQAQNCPPRWTIGQVVQTSSGLVQGHAAPKARGVSEYLGIPYAEPPVGRRRFQPPIRYSGTSKIDGSRFVRGLCMVSCKQGLICVGHGVLSVQHYVG